MKQDEQWHRAMEYVSMVSELNYMSQIVIMLYEDPTKDPTSEERFHVELHFSPGVNCCVQKNLPPGPGFRPHSRNESNTTSLSPVIKFQLLLGVFLDLEFFQRRYNFIEPGAQCGGLVST